MTDLDLRELAHEMDTPVRVRPGFQRELLALLVAELEAGTGPERELAPPYGTEKLRSGARNSRVLTRRLRRPLLLMAPVAATLALVLLVTNLACEVGARSCMGGEAPRVEARGGPDEPRLDAPHAQSESPAEGTPAHRSAPTGSGRDDPPGKPGSANGKSGNDPPPSEREIERLAFASRTDDGFWHIHTMDEDGTDRSQLTRGPAHDRAPEWSPDGARIAFMRVPQESDHSGKIFVMNSDGSKLRFLADGGEPSWSPDGTRIVYWVPGRLTSTIRIINADGSGGRALPVSGFVADPHWSPDGSLISFAGVPAAGTDRPLEERIRSTQVYTIRPDGSDTRRLTDEAWACNMAFSPDGRRIAYTMSPDFMSMSVWTMDADGGSKMRLTQGSGFNSYPHWSHDGRRIAFARDPDGEPQWGFTVATQGPAQSAIWVMRADGSHLRRISPDGADDADPVFAPPPH